VIQWAAALPERVDPPAGLHTAPSEAAASKRVPLLRGALGHGANLCHLDEALRLGRSKDGNPVQCTLDWYGRVLLFVFRSGNENNYTYKEKGQYPFLALDVVASVVSSTVNSDWSFRITVKFKTNVLKYSSLIAMLIE